jgi:hypothetical protein
MFQDAQGNQHWETWKLHVMMITIAARHSISPQDLDMLRQLVSLLHRWLIFLYEDSILTPNSHWSLHIPTFVEWYSVLRGFWTFPQESILSLAKKSTRKMTNHRAVSYSCVRLFVLERLLSQFLDPNEAVPKR